MTWGRMALAAVFGLAAGSEWYQVLEAFGGGHPDPRALVTIHAISGSAAALAVSGLLRGRRWAGLAIACWGTGVAVMLWQLGPMIGEPPEAWPGMRGAGAGILTLTLLAAWAVRPGDPA
jgi:hypothetical protein